MILEDVTLKEVDQNIEGDPAHYFRSRAIEITTDKGKFVTPIRVTTRSEYVARDGVPICKLLPLDLAVDFKEIDDAHTRGLMNEGKVGEKVLGLTRQFNDVTENAIFRASIFQPPFNILEEMSSDEKTRFADLQAEFLQLRLGTNLLTYPYLQLPVSEYLQFIDARYRRNEAMSTIFTLDMSMPYDDLKAVIDHIVSKKEPAIIALIYREWEKTIPQHSLISSYYRQEKLAFLACQVDRIEPETNTSNLHSVAFSGGFDMVCLGQRRGFGKADQKLDLNKIKFFNPTSLAIDNIDSTLRTPNRNIIRELDLPADNQEEIDYLQLILRGYRGGARHPEKFKKLLYLAKVHEAITSPKIFEKAREYVINKNTQEYIDQTNLKLVPMIRKRRI